MTHAENMTKQYKKMLKKLLELRDLLADILIKFHVIDADNGQSFHELLSYLENINTIHPYVLNGEFDTSSKIFTDIDDIDAYLYDEGHTDIANLTKTVPEINLLLVQKINSYRAYLKDYLYTVGVRQEIINENYTLRHYIECLYQIDRMKETYIIVNYDNTLYRNIHNDLPITVLDDVNEIVEDGYLIIKQDGLVIYDGILSEAYLQPSLMGQHTFTFEFTPFEDAHYTSSNAEGIFNIMGTPIEILIDSVNINEQSQYYESSSEGYAEDEWQITIQTLDPLDNILADIPIRIYVNNTLVETAYTNIVGQYVYNCKLPYSSDSDNLETILTIETTSFNSTFVNEQKTKTFIIYHHLLEIDNEYYIGQPDPLSIYLVDELTGEPITNVTTTEVIGYDDETDEEIIEEHTGLHPLFGQNLIVMTTLNEQETCNFVFFDNNKWTFNPFDSLTINAGDVALLHITTDGYDEYQLVDIKSNFILPENNVFYLPKSNFPKIYYKPLGQVYDQRSGNIEMKQYDDNGNRILWQTWSSHISNGEITNYFSSTYGAGNYELILYADTQDNINEIVTYPFIVKEPLQLTQTSYDQTTCANYQVDIFDKQSFDRLQNHLITDSIEQYTITMPNKFAIELLNEGYSVITIYDANTHITTIENEHNKLTIKNNDPYTFNKSDSAWNKITIDFDDTYKIYFDNILLTEINEEHNELKVYVLAPTQNHYRNIEIEKIYIPITVTNNGNEIDYNYTLTETADSYQYNVSICRNDDNKGSNTICATINNYAQCDTFDLYSQTFYVLPNNNLKVGNNNIQIQSFDDNINNISINHNNITQKNVIKNGDIYTVNCDIFEAGELTITVQGNNGDSETFIINVAKGDYVIDLDMPEVKEYQDHTPIPLSIKDAFNNEVNTFYCYFDQGIPISITKTNNNITLDNTAIGRQFDDLPMDDHTITVRTVANSNYNDAFITQEFLLGIYISSLTDQPLFTDLSMDNDGWLLIESLLINNNTTINDLENVLVGINTSVDIDSGKLILSNFVSSSTDLDSIVLLDDDFNNIQNAIIDINTDEDKLTYDTIEDDNL